MYKKATNMIYIFLQRNWDWLTGAGYGTSLAFIQGSSAQIIWNIFVGTAVAFITKKFLEWAFEKLRTPWKKVS